MMGFCWLLSNEKNDRGGGRPGRGILVHVGTLVRLDTKKKEKEKKNRIDRYIYYKEDELAAVVWKYYVGIHLPILSFFLFVRPDYIQAKHTQTHRGFSLFNPERPFPSKRKKTPIPKKKRRHMYVFERDKNKKLLHMKLQPLNPTPRPPLLDL